MKIDQIHIKVLLISEVNVAAASIFSLFYKQDQLLRFFGSMYSLYAWSPRS